MTYVPICPYCRDNLPSYHKSCAGCQVRLQQAKPVAPKQA